jgi:S1-C subfamily serine protease
MIRTIDGNFAKEKDLAVTKGIYVDSLLAKSAAAQAGIKVGDIIQAVNGIVVNSSPELQGMIARFRPGEKINIKINRNGDEKEIDVTLTNRDGNTAMIDKDAKEILKVIGAELEDIDEKLVSQLEIDGGVKVTKIYPGKIRKYTQMREGFIITKVDGKKVKSKEKLIEILEDKVGGLMFEGVYEEIPGVYYYAFGL